ncbi:MAG: dTDP-4-dehydrorhamnose reductase [Pseudomonadota bacterium]
MGRTGQLARALAAETADGSLTADFLDRRDCDLSQPAARVRDCAERNIADADAVLIAAAYTAVDAAEADLETAMAVNAAAPGAIAEAAASRGIPVVHVSTDYVFKGDADAPYRPDASVDPLNAYGRTKAAGERAVMEAQPRAAILRTSWVYDAVGRNFLTTMLRLGETRPELRVVDDQTGRPTYAGDLARACIAAADALVRGDARAAGIFHVTNTGDPVSWAGFARAIFETAGRDVTVTGIPSSEYPTPAQRPAYSVMDTQVFTTTFAMQLPPWRDGLCRAMEARKAHGAASGPAGTNEANP